jgi:hypothetical protein
LLSFGYIKAQLVTFDDDDGDDGDDDDDGDRANSSEYDRKHLGSTNFGAYFD